MSRDGPGAEGEPEGTEGAAQEAPAPYRRLDAIARLITSHEDTCVAVCFDETSKKILVASNTGHISQLMMSYFRFFQEITNKMTIADIERNIGGLKEKWKELVSASIAVRYNTREMREARERVRKLEGILSGGISGEERATTIENEMGKLKAQLSRMKIGTSATRQMKRRIEGLERLQRDEQSVEGLQEHIDTVKVRQKIQEKEEMGRRLLDDIEKVTRSLAKDSDPKCEISASMKQAFSRGIDSGVEFVEGEIEMHAEMKILQRMFQKISILREPIYIGISKLCCGDCSVIIDVVNEHLKGGAVMEIKEGVITRGSHRTRYRDWIRPEFIRSHPELLAAYEERVEELPVGERRSEQPLPSRSPPDANKGRILQGAEEAASTSAHLPPPPFMEDEEGEKMGGAIRGLRRGHSFSGMKTRVELSSAGLRRRRSFSAGKERGSSPGK